MVRKVVLAVLVVVLTGSAVAWAQPATAPAQGGAGAEKPRTHVDQGLALAGACIGLGLVVIGGGVGIGLIGGHAVEAVARQPEAANTLFLSWLLPAAMVEGATLFGMVLCYIAMTMLKG